MSFLQRERDRVQRALRDPSNKDRYDELYAAQQALAWASEPNGYASPMKMLTGILGGAIPESCVRRWIEGGVSW